MQGSILAHNRFAETEQRFPRKFAELKFKVKTLMSMENTLFTNYANFSKMNHWRIYKRFLKKLDQTPLSRKIQVDGPYFISHQPQIDQM